MTSLSPSRPETDASPPSPPRPPVFDPHEGQVARVSRRNATIALAAITGLAAAIRLFRIGELPFWLDEAATWHFASWTFAEMWGPEYREETNPPLFYMLQRVWSFVFGWNEGPARGLAALFGIATVPATYLLAHLLTRDRLIALTAALLLATSPIHVQYAQEARTFTLLILAAVVSLIGLTPLLRGVAEHRPSPPAWAWATYVAGCLVALYAHNTAVLLVATTWLLGVAAWWRCGRPMRFLLLWMLAHLSIGVGWLPWLPTFFTQGAVTLSEWWVPTSNLPYGLRELRGAYGVRWLPASGIGDFLLLVLAALGAWRLRRSPTMVAVAIAVVVLVPVLTYVISYWRPILITRTLLWPTPVLLILVAAGIGASRRRWVCQAALTAVLIVHAVALVSYFRTHAKMPFDQAVDHMVEQGASRDDLVIAWPGYAIWGVDYYLRDHPAPPVTARIRFSASNPAHADLGRVPLRPSPFDFVDDALVDRRHVWVVYTIGRRTRTDNRFWDALTARLGDPVDEQRFDAMWTFVGVKRFDMSRAEPPQPAETRGP
jgi:mannosyltransferase